MFGDDEAAAKAICKGCEVRISCLSDALRRREPDGVWGGFTTAERNRLLKAKEKEFLETLHNVAQGH